MLAYSSSGPQNAQYKLGFDPLGYFTYHRIQQTGAKRKKYLRRSLFWGAFNLHTGMKANTSRHVAGMPGKLCKRHWCCKQPRRFKTPDTGASGRGNAEDVTLISRCESCCSLCEILELGVSDVAWHGKDSWVADFAFQIVWGKQESWVNHYSISPTKVFLPRLAFATLIYLQRDISAGGWVTAIGHDQQRTKGISMDKRDMSHPGAPSASRSKLLTKGKES